MSEHSAVTLPDGRRLSYAEYGSATGKPILYFHGLPGSRIEARLMHEAAVAQGLRLIGVDRPGMGSSDYLAHRRIVDWPADIRSLIDALTLESPAILAVSAGAPYALACAAKIPSALAAVVLVGGLGPLTGEGLSKMNRGGRLALRLARCSRMLARVCVWFYAWRLERDAAGVVDWIGAHASPADSDALAEPRVRRNLAESFAASICHGSRGAADDLMLLTQPWGFSLTEVSLPVILWHGEADTVVPVQLGQYLADALPDSQTRFLQREGHYSLPLAYAHGILQSCADLQP